MQWVKLGDFIEQCDERNSDNKFSESDVRGISTLKLFITTKANLDGVPLSSYKVVREDEFAFVPDTSRRGDKMSLAFNNLGNPCIVSSISCVFKVKNANALLPEYLYLWFCRPDFDRYARYHSWGSAREAFSYDEMCRIEIPLPSIDEQKQVVAAWRGLKNLSEQNEQMANPLMDLCQSYLQDIKKYYKKEKIGPYIKERTEKNLDAKIHLMKGVGLKGFMKPNQIRTEESLLKCNIFYKNDLVYAPSSLRNGVIALNTDYDVAICTEEYITFYVSDAKKLLSEYLLIYMKRPEIGRFIGFITNDSVRNRFYFENLQELEIPIPPIGVQRAIVEIYNCARTSKYISETAKKLNSDICPALMRQIIGDNQ